MVIKRFIVCLITFILGVFVMPLVSNTSYADTIVPQAGANPIVFNQTATTDNVMYLMAAGSEHNSSLTIDNYGAPKHMWINNFFGRTSDYMIWTVSLPTAADYHVDALLSSSANTPLKLSVVGTSNVLNFTTNSIGWDKLNAGIISLPAGTSQIKLEGTAGTANGMAIKSLELIRNSDYAAYLSRISSFKKDTTWLSNAGYGLMFQYGAWGYPQTGTTKKSLDNQAADFNVTNFVNMVKSTGASYVIWSASWWTYQINAPISAVDNIVGNGNRTSTRDLIGEIATALHANNIKFMLYYHTGQDSHLGYNSTDFWQAQSWPSAFTTTGVSDRSTFFTNWRNIISEMGNRYGTNLDGWFFDDGTMYYPAPFEQLGQAARAGNPNRLVSYNSWIASRFTDFQDVYFAEGDHGEVHTGSAPVGGNGVFTSGPQKGLLQQAMFMMEQDWGVHVANTAINTQITSTQASSWLQSASSRKVPLSFNMMMWEDGSVSPQSLQILIDLKNAAATPYVNDTDTTITYSGSSWGYSNNRGAGDYNNDLHYTANNSDYFQYTFSGTGIDFIGPKASNQGNIDIYIDGVLQTTVTANNGGAYQAKQTIYSKTGLSNGSHVFKAVKKDGAYMQLNELVIHKTVQLNNTDLAYTGGWSVSSGRGLGDFLNDVHYTTTNGDAMSYTFSGTGVDYITEKNSDQGNVDVYIDGTWVQTVNCSNPTRLAQQTVYTVNGLTQGKHTIKLVKASGTYMLVDSLITRS